MIYEELESLWKWNNTFRRLEDFELLARWSVILLWAEFYKYSKTRLCFRRQQMIHYNVSLAYYTSNIFCGTTNLDCILPVFILQVLNTEQVIVIQYFQLKSDLIIKMKGKVWIWSLCFTTKNVTLTTWSKMQSTAQYQKQ